MTLSPDLLEPIAGDNPAGVELRYEPIYDRIKEARREDLDIPAGAWQTTRKTADWPLVVKLATEVLTQQSKDLQIAAWLTEAWLWRDGIPGLRRGLELLQGLVTTFWDDVYPELDEDGDSGMRAAPLAWVGLKLDVATKSAPIAANGFDYLSYSIAQSIPTEQEAEEDYDRKAIREAAEEEGKPTPEAFESAFNGTPKEWYRELAAEIDAAMDLLGRLEQKSDELFEDEAPSYRVLRESIEEVGRTVKALLARKIELDPDPEPVAEEVVTMEAGHLVAEIVTPAAGGGGDATSSPAVAAGGNAGSISATPSSMDDASARIASAARYLRSQSPTNPAPYMLLRGYRWGELRVGAGKLDPKLLEAPPTPVRVRLKTLSLDGKWAELLEAVEEVMAAPYGRGWLDLQRHALNACERLGSAYDRVASGIQGELRLLIADLPELPYATLMDDTPTANPETLQWLESNEFLKGDPSTAAVAGTRASTVEREPRERALEYVRAGSPEKAIQYLMREAAQARSARARFLRRTEATAVMVNHGLTAVALPILRELAGQIDDLQLENWESGELIAEPLGLLYRCLHDDPDTQEELYLRICRLDPIHAMEMRPNGESASNGAGDESGYTYDGYESDEGE